MGLPKLYSKEDANALFNKHKFWLWDQNVISEGQLFDLFGPDIIPFLDRQWNIMYPHLNEKPSRLVHDGSEWGGCSYRAVNFAGFLDVISYVNGTIIENYYTATYGGAIAKFRFMIEESERIAKIEERERQEEERHAAEVARAEELRKKRHEYYLKQKAKKAKEAAEG